MKRRFDSWTHLILTSAAIVMVLVLNGCWVLLDDDDDDDTAPIDDTVPPGDDDTELPDVTPVVGSYELSGTVSFESVPYDLRNEGLDYSGTVVKPIRAVPVSLIDALEGTLIAETESDASGRYDFAWEGTNWVKLWVYAETNEPRLIIEDNTQADAVYVIESERTNVMESPELDFVAKTGWEGAAYMDERAAAPLAILDAAYTSAIRFLTETDSPPEFPDLRINWSINNRPESGDKSRGQITTSHWDQSELYILGKEDVDTDEFDSHIIVHEWGHYFESKISRSDSIGGSHTAGDVLDPRVALGEGWGNALSAIILDPNSVYSDAMSRSQASGFHFDLEENDIDPAYSPGWWGEWTVQAIIFDLYDGANETFDPIELGLNPLYEVMIGNEKTTDALTTLFTFISTLKDINPELADDIDSLVEYHTIDSQFGINAIQDDWATGETHDAAIPTALPLYKDISIGDSMTLTLDGRYDSNKLAQNRYLAIETDGSLINVVATSTEDIDIYVLHNGNYIAWAYSEATEEEVEFKSINGDVYIINIQGWGTIRTTYFVDVSVSN